VVVGGVACGTWARKGDELTVAWLGQGRPPEQAIAQESARLSGILGRDLHLSLTT
jgi:hypothetical protein